MTEFLVFVERLMNKCRLSCDQRIPFHLHSTRFVIGQVGNTVFMTFCAFARMRQPKKTITLKLLIISQDKSVSSGAKPKDMNHVDNGFINMVNWIFLAVTNHKTLYYA